MSSFLAAVHAARAAKASQKRTAVSSTSNTPCPAPDGKFFVVGWRHAGTPVAGVRQGQLFFCTFAAIHPLVHRRKGVVYKSFRTMEQAAQWPCAAHMLPFEAAEEVRAMGPIRFTKPLSAVKQPRCDDRPAARHPSPTKRARRAAPPAAAAPRATIGRVFVACDGSALSWNGQPTAPGGAGVALGIELEEGVFAVQRSLAKPMPWRPLALTHLDGTAPHTNVRAEWFGFVCALEELLQFAETTTAGVCDATTRVDVWVDYRDIARTAATWKVQDSKGPDSCPTPRTVLQGDDPNQWWKHCACRVWRCVVLPRFPRAQVHWIKAHQSAAAASNWTTTEGAFVVKLNNMVDRLSKQAAETYRAMYPQPEE